MTADDAVKRSPMKVAVRSGPDHFMLYKESEDSVAVAIGKMPIPEDQLKFQYVDSSERLKYSDWQPMNPVSDGHRRSNG